MRGDMKPLRTILAIFAADEVDPAKAYDAARKGNLESITLFQASGTLSSSSHAREYAQRYSTLRLDGEFLLVAQAEPAKVQSAIQLLQSQGSPAIFLYSDIIDGSKIE